MYTKAEKEQAYSKYKSLLSKFKIEQDQQCVLQSAISAWSNSKAKNAADKIDRLTKHLTMHTNRANSLLIDITNIEEQLKAMHIRFSKVDFETGEIVFSEESLK